MKILFTKHSFKEVCIDEMRKGLYIPVFSLELTEYYDFCITYLCLCSMC